MIGIPIELIHGVLKGIFFSLWIIGSAILTYFIVKFGVERTRRRRRLHNLDNSGGGKLSFAIKDIPVVRRFSVEMEIAEIKISIEVMLCIMLLFVLVGFFGADGGIFLLQQSFATGTDLTTSSNSWIVSLFIAFLCGSLPYFYIRFKVQKKRHRIANRMITIVQNIIGHYRTTITIAEMVTKCSATMPDDVKSEWKRLELMLHMQSTEVALFDFAERIDNAWGDDLADILLIGSVYGSDISGALHKLVQDMQTSKRNEEKRLAMITVYRIGTLMMVGFGFFVIWFNIYADGSNYRHYFLDPTGKTIIIVCVIVLFGSLLSVARSGRKSF